MSSQLKSPQRRQEFFATELAPCPYLPGKLERRLVTAIRDVSRSDLLDVLTEAGFRRSQNYLYRPACDHCNACVPVQINVADFKPGRNLRKTINRNSDLSAEIVPTIATDDQFKLFRRYLGERHESGGMASMTWWDYKEMVEQTGPSTLLVEFRDQNNILKGVTLTDRVQSGLSGVYKFFEPAEPKRSLGTYIILWHVHWAKEQNLPFVYLGYWIKNCRKMAYKVRFPAIERLDEIGWVRFENKPD